MNFEKIIAQNRLKTNAVLATYCVIFAFIGLLVDVIRINANDLGIALFKLITFQIFPTITIVMFFVAFVIIVICIQNFSSIMLSGDEYTLIDPNKVLSSKENQIYGVFSELLEEAKLNFEPKLYIINAPYMNAFASGWNESNSLIALTSALIERLDRDELKAVIAHELSHIRHNDIRLTMCVGILSNIMLLVANFSVYFFMGNRKNNGANLARSILLVLQIILPFLTLILQMYLSRTREYMADSGAAFLMHDSKPMIRALQKISNDYSKNDYKEIDTNSTRYAAYIFNSEIFSTHPSIKNRIQSLTRRA
ncbi:zinc metalloprotease HtpX [Helicobacter cetorum]|uniref:Protease HtpX homolog n=1 Tax=Helicobacter cetorum (strain ATCC BAA-540 / CCUG 52418 / MIT 99-5656) TaxID=1163745 RepID=I0ETB4_HELCM|nr:zinc metalloprotease HtpX [Helicobacter cetorum]AFI06183.1 heat shock protein HtpX [Helicobacter cetorum MIT 99-5656]